jgi:hypothetical protein
MTSKTARTRLGNGKKLLPRAAAVALASAAWATPAHAQDEPPVPPTPASQPTTLEETTYVPPNRAIIAGGVAAFLGAYLPGVVVAIANDKSYDDKLYIPVAGPWVALSDRPPCGSGIGQTSCTLSNTYEWLLISSGIVQGLGVIAIALGVVVPERRTHLVSAPTAERPSVQVVPTAMGREGYGVAAFGKF